MALSQHAGQVQPILGRSTHSWFDILTHISQGRPVVPVHLRPCQHSLSCVLKRPLTCPSCVYTCTDTSASCTSGTFLELWAFSLGQLALSVSMVFSNQHIPLSLDRHSETILAAHTQGGVMLISCPLTSDYTHTQLLYCFCSCSHSKTPHSCT